MSGSISSTGAKNTQSSKNDEIKDYASRGVSSDSGSTFSARWEHLRDVTLHCHTFFTFDKEKVGINDRPDYPGNWCDYLDRYNIYPYRTTNGKRRTMDSHGRNIAFRSLFDIVLSNNAEFV